MIDPASGRSRSLDTSEHVKALQREAVRYARRGVPVFRLRPRSKKPLEEGSFYNATSDVATVEQLWAHRPFNIGCEPASFCQDGRCAIVIDLDVKPGVNGFEVLAELEQGYGPLPSTATVLTGSGGEQRWYWLPVGVLVSSSAATFGGTGVDVRCKGGYGILPPSVHPNGERYKWDAGGDRMAELPQSWVDALVAQQDGPPERSHINGVDDDEPIPSGKRHATLKVVAARMRYGGLTDAPIYAALCALSDAKCDPPHTKAEQETELRALADWAATLKPGKASLDAADKAECARDEEAWDALSPPVLDKGEPPMLPRELLPPALGPWIIDEAERMSVYPEAIALPALVALGSVIACGCGITPRREDPGFSVIPSTWGAFVAPPGFLKTPALGAATAPLRGLQQNARLGYQEERARIDVRRKFIELQRKGSSARLDGELRKRKPDETEIAIFEHQIVAFDAELAQLQAVEPRFFTNDATVEKLAMLLAANDRGLLVLLDEVSGWLLSFDKTGRASDRKFYLQAWQGMMPYNQDRVGRGSIYIPRLSLAVYGGIQPDVMRKYVEQAQGTSEFNDGLLQRFQLTAWIDTLPPYIKNDRPANDAARDTAFRIFQSLAKFDAAASGARIVNGIPTLRFDPGAQDLFDDYRYQLERRLRTDEELRANPALAAHLAKYRSLMPTMALLYHLADGDPSGGSVSPVSLRAAQNGAAWTDYLEPHARKLYASGNGGSGYSPTERLMEEIEKGTVTDKLPVREVYRRGWRGLATVEQVKIALRPLIVANWLRLEMMPTRGRWVEVIRLHPKLRGG